MGKRVTAVDAQSQCEMPGVEAKDLSGNLMWQAGPGSEKASRVSICCPLKYNKAWNAPDFYQKTCHLPYSLMSIYFLFSVAAFNYFSVPHLG